MVAKPDGDLEPMSQEIKTLLEQMSSKPQTVPQVAPSKPNPRAATAKPSSDDATRKYVLSALEKECTAVRNAPEGMGNHQINSSAFALGQLVGAGVLSESEARVALEDAVNSWAKPDPNAQASIDSGIQAGKLEPRDMSHVGTKMLGKQKPKAAKPSTGKNSSDPVAKSELPEFSLVAGDYAVTKNYPHIVEIKKGKEVEKVMVKICNFFAWITAETTKDDGSGTNQKYITLEGVLEDGTALHQIDVPTSSFGGMAWVTKEWGARAIVQPYQNAQNKLRHAIQVLSAEKDYNNRTVYTHTGWRDLKGFGHVYLHTGGALGSSGAVPNIEVDLAKYERYSLPSGMTNTETQTAIQASLTLLETAPNNVTTPLWLAVWRSVLGAATYNIFVYGITGTGKSGLVGLMLSHFGSSFRGHTLPDNWESTPSKLEKLLFTLKDAVTVIDDFNPKGSSIERQKLHSMADRILRGQANGQSRGRMTWGQGGVLEAATQYKPRGLTIVTGEDIPTGTSLRARNLILELKRGDLRRDKLMPLNQAAENGVLANGMSAYIQWLAPRLEDVQAWHRVRSQQHDLELSKILPDTTHGQTLNATADLLASLEVWLSFALETGSMTQDQAGALLDRADNALVTVAMLQTAHQSASDPVTRFIELLVAVLSSGKAHLLEQSSGKPLDGDDSQQWGYALKTRGGGMNESERYEPQGTCIGWLGDDAILLNPQAAWSEIQAMANKQGEVIAKSFDATKKALAERGVISTYPTKKGEEYTVLRRISGNQARVLEVRISSLETSKDDSDKNSGYRGVNKSVTSVTGAKNSVLDRLYPLQAIRNVTDESVTPPAPDSSSTAQNGQGEVLRMLRAVTDVHNGLDTVNDSSLEGITDVTDYSIPIPLPMNMAELQSRILETLKGGTVSRHKLPRLFGIKSSDLETALTALLNCGEIEETAQGLSLPMANISRVTKPQQEGEL
jgi:hypothetical protein